LYNTLLSIKNGTFDNEITISADVGKYAKIALQRMFEV